MFSSAKKHLKLLVAAIGLNCMILLTGGMSVNAEEIELVPAEKITEEDLRKAPGWETKSLEEFREKNRYSDYIAKLIRKYDTLTFKSGETYTLDYTILIPSDRAITINATGATIICKKGLVKNEDYSKGDYTAVHGFKMIGGTWLAPQGANPFEGSSIQFAYADNLTFKNMTIKHAGGDRHALELVACRNVNIDGCTIEAISAPSKSSSVEEQIQIDQATKNLAAFLPSNLQNGTCCQNVTINNCVVKGGGRGICANLDVRSKNSAYYNKYHKNIKITNCEVVGETSEGIMLFNTKGATVTGNNVISNGKKSRKYYSIGIHMQFYGKGKGLTSGKNVIKNNTVKSKSYGIMVASGGTGNCKFGKTTIKNNIVSTKVAKDSAIFCDNAKKKSIKGNKVRK
ncbi:right-handed parallel beta-helix repeat-containing protein [Butyrivibrio sp. NC2002]|uniref:right-handed parallel beta-helix repeat-containing protein n=1 Tax=Butyrivibrio sp. NC2002 TaxID=1410610 RepID=UPI0005645F6E|nr:right-handed parallel beta-helix repeat-containing protein [Butyrivibrio sp. NC2002]